MRRQFGYSASYSESGLSIRDARRPTLKLSAPNYRIGVRLEASWKGTAEVQSLTSDHLLHFTSARNHLALIIYVCRIEKPCSQHIHRVNLVNHLLKKPSPCVREIFNQKWRASHA